MADNSINNDTKPVEDKFAKKTNIMTPENNPPPKPTIPFWSENPNILFKPEYIFEFFPVDTMSYTQKLNAISRTIVILTIVSFLLSQNTSILLISLITLGAIVLLYYYQKEKEAFGNRPAIDYLNQNGGVPKNVFSAPNSGNPFGNIMLPDYDYNPNKKPAPPSYNDNTGADILQQAKQLVINANPDQPDIADKLFKDLGDEFMFEQSMRPFFSNPATTIPNDQEAFSNFCYGSMVSCKEGNLFACARNLDRHTNQ